MAPFLLLVHLQVAWGGDHGGQWFRDWIRGGNPGTYQLFAGVLAKVSRACLEWLKQQRSLTGLVTGVMLKEKALSFNQKFGGDPSFQASDG